LDDDYEIQFLTLPHLDERLLRRSSGLLYKICKAQEMLPTSHIIQPEHIRVGEFRWKGGFADVGKGEHCGRPVAVKQLRIERRDEPGNTFKVSSSAGQIALAHSPPSNFVGRY